MVLLFAAMAGVFFFGFTAAQILLIGKPNEHAIYGVDSVFSFWFFFAVIYALGFGTAWAMDWGR